MILRQKRKERRSRCMGASKKVKEFMEKSSWIRRMFEEGMALKKKLGEDKVFDFTLGNPILEPPNQFKECLKELAINPVPGMHRYMPNAGYPETRMRIAQYLSKKTGLKFTAEHIIMTVGAGGGLNVILKTILDPGDEVIILSPYFAEYIFYIDNHGGRCCIVDTEEDFSLNLGNIEKAINAKTKAILINSPNNPTGKVYDEKTLEGLSEILSVKAKEMGREIYLLSDEAYRMLIYDGKTNPELFCLYPDCIVVGSYSKDLSIAGERIGYVAVSPNCSDWAELIAGMTFAIRTLGFVNAPALMQRIVSNLQGLSVDVSSYERKRNLIYQGLVELGYLTIKPEGAFYIFPKTPIEDDLKFVRELQEENILVVPGSGFGRPGYFRIAYCVEDSVIERSMEGFGKLAKKYGLI